MTGYAWYLSDDEAICVVGTDDEVTALCNRAGDPDCPRKDAEGIVTLVNAYPALRDALHAHQFCHLAGLFDPTGVKLGMLKRAVEDKDAKITRLRDELNTTRPYRELWEAAETERNIVECERDRLREALRNLWEFVDDIRKANDCAYFNEAEKTEPGETAYQQARAALTAAPAPPRTD